MEGIPDHLDQRVFFGELGQRMEKVMILRRVARFDACFHLRRDKVQIADVVAPAAHDIADPDIAQAPDFAEVARTGLGKLHTFARAKDVQLFHFVAAQLGVVRVPFSVQWWLLAHMDAARIEAQIGDLLARCFAFDLEDNRR